ncbi:MAG: nucleotidyl transferase AbiEii/AbiGii toxin family protein [Candidatus Schekmanbacteria bacterium]|nr:nucleotidyl transferase AbiEii/AbiGii toxin family protein [Candidatus Schekmanbacteria bacterium]
MALPSENKDCYASKAQREVLLHLITNPDIEKTFFLTGGTALSVFYLHHRISNDLDFFTLEREQLSEIDFWIRREWVNECTKLKEGPHFLSLMIREVKVDFVIDPLSIAESRFKFHFENGHTLLLDTIDNIVSNKFCTLVSRTEPKDFIDFYFIQKMLNESNIEQIYKNAKKKDAIFEDVPTVAFQIEEGLKFLRDNERVIPLLTKSFSREDFYHFYDGLIKWLYKQVSF